MSRDIKEPGYMQNIKSQPIPTKAHSRHESVNVSQEEDVEPILSPSNTQRAIGTNGEMQTIQPEMIKVGSQNAPAVHSNPMISPAVLPTGNIQGNPTGQPQQLMQMQPTQNFIRPSPYGGRAPTMQNFQEQGGPSNYESSQVCIGKCTGWLGTYVPCLCCCQNPYKTVPEGFSGIVMRFGKFSKLVGPGMHYILNDLDTLVLVDKREKVMDLKSQNVVSKDNTSFNIDAVVYYRIFNTYKSKFAVANLTASLNDLTVTCLRNAVGRMTIQQFLELRDHLAEKIEEEIVHVAASWGVKVIRVLVQDVVLPVEFRNSFSTGALAKKISEAQVIASKAEVQVAKLMKDAAEALNTDAAFQIRYITALEAITNNSNPKMIFFPSDFNDVGTANDEIMNSMMAEEVETLVKKR